MAVTNAIVRNDGEFERTALCLEKETVHSIDVLTPEGKLWPRLNIASPTEEQSWGNVDVVFNTQDAENVKKKASCMAWREGSNVLDVEVPEGCSLVAINIQREAT